MAHCSSVANQRVSFVGSPQSALAPSAEMPKLVGYLDMGTKSSERPKLVGYLDMGAKSAAKAIEYTEMNEMDGEKYTYIEEVDDDEDGYSKMDEEDNNEVTML